VYDVQATIESGLIVRGAVQRRRSLSLRETLPTPSASLMFSLCPISAVHSVATCLHLGSQLLITALVLPECICTREFNPPVSHVF
jgi:hypothetical protein